MEGRNKTLLSDGIPVYVENPKGSKKYVKENAIKVVDDLREYRETIYTAACYDADYWYSSEGYGYYQFEMQYNEVRLYLYDRINFLDEILDGAHHDLFI